MWIKTLSRIWGFVLFCGLWLLLTCVIFMSVPVATATYRNELLYIGTIGAVLVVVCITIACWFKPLNNYLLDGCVINSNQIQNNLQQPIVNTTAATRFIVIANNEKHIIPELVVATFIQNNDRVVIPENIAVAEPVNQV